MTEVNGWIASQLKDGTWALRYFAKGGVWIAGFETSRDAFDWLLMFFNQNAERDLREARRERRQQELLRQNWEGHCAFLLGKANEGKVH
jgi:hypothetical protein